MNRARGIYLENKSERYKVFFCIEKDKNYYLGKYKNKDDAKMVKNSRNIFKCR